MASIRIGFSSDFVLKNGVVGLGTTVGSTTDGKLELDNGALRADFSVTGVATLTAYGGFVAQKQHVNKPAAIGFGTVGLQTAGVGTAYQYYETETEFTDLGGVHHGDDQYFNTLSEDLVIDDGQILNITNTDMVGVTTIGEYDPHNHSSYVCAGSLEQVSVTGHFSVPNGGTNDRQETPIEGTVRFNTDLNTLEFFNGNEWRQFTYNQGQSGRMVMFGGMFDYPASDTSTTIDYLNINTLGNAQHFGDLTAKRGQTAGCASETRGLSMGGNYAPGAVDIIEYVTIASAGDAIDFGDTRNDSQYGAGACSSSTRGFIMGGWGAIAPASASNLNTIDYVQISTLGNALDFGDLTNNASRYGPSFSSPVRGFYVDGSGSPRKEINVWTMASKGNSIDWGDSTDSASQLGGCSNSVRGVFLVQQGDPGDTTYFDQVSLSSLGNATYFGELNDATSADIATGSTQTRGVFAGGFASPALTNRTNIDYVTIMSAGNAQDFGDLLGKGAGKSLFRGCSDSHGGLGGF